MSLPHKNQETKFFTATPKTSDYFKACPVGLERGNRLGLLDLPAEIRLEIYPYLLSSARRIISPSDDGPSYCDIPVVNVCSNHGRNENLSPSTIVYRSRYTQRTGYDIWPEVLSTCRLIYQEAIPFFSFYSESCFEFFLSRTSGPVADQEDIEDSVPDIFEYSETDWDEGDVPDVFKCSEFAAWIAKIGPGNARKVAQLHFKAFDCDGDIVAEQMPIITELVRQHMSGLRGVFIYIPEKDTIYWDESPDYYHPDRSSPFWALPSFEPMYRALEDFVLKIHWLGSFEYQGQSDFTAEAYHQGLDGWWRLKELEDLVLKRKVEEEFLVQQESSSSLGKQHDENREARAGN